MTHIHACPDIYSQRLASQANFHQSTLSTHSHWFFLTFCLLCIIRHWPLFLLKSLPKTVEKTRERVLYTKKKSKPSHGHTELHIHTHRQDSDSGLLPLKSLNFFIKLITSLAYLIRFQFFEAWETVKLKH